MSDPRPPAEPRRAWTIEVCATCDRLAVWPFCEHRPISSGVKGAHRWTETVVVGTRAKKRGRRG